MLKTVRSGAQGLFEVPSALILLTRFFLGRFFLLPRGCDSKKTYPLPFIRLRREQDGTHWSCVQGPPSRGHAEGGLPSLPAGLGQAWVAIFVAYQTSLLTSSD